MDRTKRSRPDGKKDRSVPEARVCATVEVVPTWMPRWLDAGIVLLFVAGCAWGVLEVHYSNDTWIGLTAGRQIMTEPWFPKVDTFSYSVAPGTIWFNQNWLTHVAQWLLYSKLGENWVIYGTWATGIAMFVLVLVATKLRCGSWRAATLCGALVAIASRDWLSARPATVQFFLLALLWLSLSALISQGKRRRWWAVILLLPVFLVWTHAHGSFVFGYAMVGMFLACAGVALLFRCNVTVSWAQIAAIVAIALVTGVLGAVLSPYGLENYTHPLKVAESAVFREVGEWIAPYREASFPPVLRFWIAFAVAAACPLGAAILRLGSVVLGVSPAPARPSEPSVGPENPFGRLQIVLFDVASVGIGLYMAIFARRFAPLFYILATPALAAWTLQLGRGLPVRLRGWARDAVVLAAWPAAALTISMTIWLGYRELVKQFPPSEHASLLDRVTRMDACPRELLEFLSRNKLTPNVLTEWTQGGLVMFFVPGAKVFIDGRAQQVYTEEHYLTNMWFVHPYADENELLRVIDQYHTEAVLMRATPFTRHLLSVLGRQPQSWSIVMGGPSEALFARRGSNFMQELLRREQAGDLWWPNTPEAESARGFLWLAIEPPDPARALHYWQDAVARSPLLGVQCYGPITNTLLNNGQRDMALAYLQAERTRILATPSNLPEEQRVRVLQALELSEGMLDPTRRPRSPG